jgi:hypothetical protein
MALKRRSTATAMNRAGPADIAIGVDLGRKLSYHRLTLQRSFQLNAERIDFVLYLCVHRDIKLVHGSTPNEMKGHPYGGFQNVA